MNLPQSKETINDQKFAIGYDPRPEPFVHKIRLIHPMAKLPIKRRGSAGYDLFSPSKGTISPHKHGLIKLGLEMEIDSRCFGKIFSRSGLCLKQGIEVGAGVIDADYRGEVGVVLFNRTDKPFTFGIGDRIAQMVIFQNLDDKMILSKRELSQTKRGTGGFGSSGK